MVVPPLGTSSATIKLLCSYGGKILPRYPDGKLRYHGGETRLLSLHRSISFSELLLKLGELCGQTSVTVSLRCQLPTEDLDALVSITSDEDLLNLIEEYDRFVNAKFVSTIKIRAFLSFPKKIPTFKSPPESSLSQSSSSKSSSSSSSSSLSSGCHGAANATSGSVGSGTITTINQWCYHQLSMSKPVAYPVKKIAPHYGYHVHDNPTGHIYLVHHGNHWQ